jgi:hypothetical protein
VGPLNVPTLAARSRPPPAAALRRVLAAAGACVRSAELHRLLKQSPAPGASTSSTSLGSPRAARVPGTSSRAIPPDTFRRSTHRYQRAMPARIVRGTVTPSPPSTVYEAPRWRVLGVWRSHSRRPGRSHAGVSGTSV